MKIEIYLKHIFQEYATTEAVSMGSRLDNPWDLKYERNCGCRGNVCMPPMDLERVYIQRVFLRPESFGGLLYDPTSATIYKLDQEAYQLVERLRADESVAKLRKNPDAVAAFAKRNGLKSHDVANFIAQLREFELW